MQVLEADAIGVVERSRATTVNDSLKVAAGDWRDRAKRRGGERNDVRPSSLCWPRARVLAALTCSDAREECAVRAEGVAQRWAGVADDDVKPREPAVIAEDKVIRAFTARRDAGDVQARFLSGPDAMRGNEGTPGAHTQKSWRRESVKAWPARLQPRRTSRPMAESSGRHASSQGPLSLGQWQR